MSVLRFEHVRLVDADRDVPDGWILIRDGSIEALGEGTPPPAPAGCESIHGGVVMPGFVDLHGHGAAGGLYEEGADAAARAVDFHLRQGTTTLLMSISSMDPAATLATLTELAGLCDGAGPAYGVHMEGPFLDPGHAGASDRKRFRLALPAEVGELADVAGGVLRYVTMAPEREGAIAAIRQFAAAGVVVGLGHCAATADEGRRGLAAGATVITHLFNAMPPLHHREPGLVGVGLTEDCVAELIYDGIHVDRTVARLVFRSKPHQVALITDSIAATGSVDGLYSVNGRAMEVRDGIARVVEDGTLAGSSLTMRRAVIGCVSDGVADLQQAVEAATRTPARVLGLDGVIGSLRPGYRADLVQLSADWEVRQVWRHGRSVR